VQAELEIHSGLVHDNIVGFVGAGTTTKGMRFLVLERLDGGTLAQVLGYDTRIRDRRKRFWKRRQMSYVEVLTHSRCLADAMAYLQSRAKTGSMILHRDLKPDNIAFTLAGELKLIDFGLAKELPNVKIECDDVYAMSGETGSLRYMAPEVADNRPYNHKADVYSFGIILWEMVAYVGERSEAKRGEERRGLRSSFPSFARQCSLLVCSSQYASSLRSFALANSLYLIIIKQSTGTRNLTKATAGRASTRRSSRTENDHRLVKNGQKN